MIDTDGYSDKIGDAAAGIGKDPDNPGKYIMYIRTSKWKKRTYVQNLFTIIHELSHAALWKRCKPSPHHPKGEKLYQYQLKVLRTLVELKYRSNDSHPIGKIPWDGSPRSDIESAAARAEESNPERLRFR